MFKRKINTKQRTLVTSLNSKSPIFEAYRTLRTNIQFSSVDQDMRSIVVTSSGPGEGKSTTTANLAVAFAQQGKKVLLVDGDLRKPTMQYTFQVQNISGLTSVLSRQSTLDKVVQKTNIDNLYLLTSGPIPPNPSEMLGSNGMKDLLAEALQEYEYVLFDSPPVLAVTDAQILSNMTDGNILVVKSGQTEQEAAVRAKELLLASKGKMLGAVLNGKSQKDNTYYYYY
ncbi:CpsD/CapB family tyrosine-protein kinase [Fictibacillus aquaticus]|uniref:non-specific protein-tyrosine kinase n=1 Tax=Fictibacillus aquaticus TaxID=2021314 RepID=A0A235F9G7_9BACL|nr:CpsD/CapB family tyrosine-protein kinase [Fictibacillus aquaticus]OYD57597.1 capsular biosynthesis protein [Fictibacillus aquaticus]